MSGIMIVFWCSVILILYSYVGYPFVLKMMSLFKPGRRSLNARSIEPKVTVLISAYNEEAVIEEKILNSLALKYPRGLL
jgi:poly-beta-1,6-N-acetyl-D-glucosamine synthase